MWHTNAERWAGKRGCCSFRFLLSAFRLPLSPFDNLFRRATGNNVAAVDAGFGADVDDPIGGFDDVEVVLDHDDRVAQVDEPIEHFEQFGEVVEVQTGRRFVEQVQRLAGVGPGELGGEFHALRFAARKGRRALAEREVIEAHVAQRLQNAANLGNVGEQLDGLAARHVEHVGDAFAVELHFEHVAVVALAAARVALDPDVGQEVHFDADLAVAFARFAAAAGDVEAESPRRCSRAVSLRAIARRVGGSIRTRRCRWPGSRSACCRAAADRRGSLC